MPTMQRRTGGVVMKSDIGAVLDVLSEVLELVEILRSDVILMMEERDNGESE